MAKARAIVKRRKAVRNIKKITKTMQMIATAKFQKSLKRAVGTKPYTMKVRELVRELAATVGEVDHPLLRTPTAETRTNRIALIVLSSNRGLAGAYNGNVLRTATRFIQREEAAGKTVDLYVAGKKGVSYFTFQKRAVTARFDIGDPPRAELADRAASTATQQFIDGQIDGVYVAYMNFISTGVQRPEVMELLPLASVHGAADAVAKDLAEREAQIAAGTMDANTPRHAAQGEQAGEANETRTQYDFYPDPKTLFDELLPLTVRSAFFQTFLDAATSEHVARMVSMKSATDNADKMVKALTMQYNRARQSQITTELSEIMGGVEAMKG